MDISDELRNRIVEELHFAAKKMRQEVEMNRKLYFFSAAYGVTNRALNEGWDLELVTTDFILHGAYNTIKNRTNIIRGGDKTIVLPSDFFDKLSAALDSLAGRIEHNDSCYGALQEIVKLTYITTGNGYYLLQKGKIALE